MNDNGIIPKKRRRLKISHILIILLLIGAGSFAYHRLSLKSKLRARIDAIRAAGDPVTLEELWPPEIEPPSENAALLYEQASDLFDRGGFESSVQSLGRDVSWGEPSAWSEETAAAVRQMVEQCEEALDLVRLAGHMKRCRFDPEWGCGCGS